MKTVKGMPITGAKRHFSNKRPFVPDAKETSANVETMIKEPPAPFKNRMTTAQMPAGMGAAGATPGLEPVVSAGKAGSRAPFHPAMGAAGQRTMPNQSGQVNGRMGTSFPKRKGNPATQRRAKKGSAFFGE